SIVWWGALLGGIHPTLAGVIVGLVTPVTGSYGARSFHNREAVAPVERLQHSLHGWVAFGIMPLFAFANAGVPLGHTSFQGDALWVFLGVTAGLVVGKPMGILALSWLAVRLGLAALPNAVQWGQIMVAGIGAGIWFTIGLFVAQLAFPSGPLLEMAKLAILCGSVVAGALALVLGYRVLRLENIPEEPPTRHRIAPQQSA